MSRKKKRKKNISQKKKRKRERAKRKNARRRKNRELNKLKNRQSGASHPQRSGNSNRQGSYGISNDFENEFAANSIDDLIAETIAKMREDFPFLDSSYSDDEFFDYDLDNSFFPGERIPIQSENYLEDMKKYADYSVPEAVKINYEDRIPAYDQMSKAQLDYYIYWRGLARGGKFLPASYNYYQLYTVELLNKIGFDTEEECFENLLYIWDVFADEFGINDYVLTEIGRRDLARQIFDFAYYHDQDLTKLRPVMWEYIDSAPRRILALDYFSRLDKLELPFELIESSSDFDFQSKSRIIEGHEKLLKEAIMNVFYVLDATIRREKGVGLLESIYNPEPFNQYFLPFEMTIMDRDSYDTDKELKTRLGQGRTNDLFSTIIQQTENSLRDFFDIRGRLRKYKVDDWIKKTTDSFIASYYDPEKKNTYSMDFETAKKFINSLSEKKKVKIDTSRLEKLRNDTKTVQEILDSSEYEETSQSSLEYTDALSFVLSNLKKLDADYPDQLAKLLKEDESDKLRKNIELINQTALRFLSAPLLIFDKGKLVLNNIYIPSLEYIFEHLDEYPFLKAEKHDLEIEISDEIYDFLESLSPGQLEFFKILKAESSPERKLEELAQSEMTMVDLMYDDINNDALLYLDDIVLEMDEMDKPCIIEEYEESIKKALELEVFK